jgi:hypothetical protein
MNREQKQHERFAAPVVVTEDYWLRSAEKCRTQHFLLCCFTVTDTLCYRHCFVRHNSCKIWICAKFILNVFFLD